jgi:REP element-mobilizing transposase RayT
MKPNNVTTESPRTWGRGRAVRLDSDLYAMDLAIHLTICALAGRPFGDHSLATMTCTAIERTCTNLRYSLFAYCLMPDHLHVLLSPDESEVPIADFLRRFKSYTTRQYQKATGITRLWQYSARDSIV